MLPPEFEIVVACCAWPRDARDRERIAMLAGRAPDWELVAKIAARHRVSALVHHALKTELRLEVGSNPGIAELARQANVSMRQGLLQGAESARLLKLLNAAEVQPLFLKGVALSMLAFGNIALRSAKDIDLLVTEDEMAAAEAVLLAEGYELNSNQGVTGNTLQERMRERKDFEYLHPGRRIQVELHWRTFRVRRLAEGVPIAGRQMVAISPTLQLPTLADDELLLYLVAHGAHHSWNRLKWLADVGALLGQRTEGFEAASAALLQRARSSDMGQPVEQALLLMRRLFGRPLALPRMGWRSHLLSAVALRSMTTGDIVTEPLEAPVQRKLTVLSELLLRPRLSYVLEVVRYLMYFPDEVGLPTGVPRIAYPFWRVFRSLKNSLPKSMRPRR